MLVKKIKNILLKIKDNPLAVFLLKGFLFYLVWELLVYNYIITPAMHEWVIYCLVDASHWVLAWFYQAIETFGTEIFINGKHCVHIGIPCNGIDVMGVFACIVLAFSAHWYHKAWIILVACILVFLLNTARICGLAALIAAQQIRAFDINHKYIFNTLLYGILLIIFSVWSSKFGTKQKVKHTN